MCCVRILGGRSRSSYKLYSSYIQLLLGDFSHIVRDHTLVPCRFFASSNRSHLCYRKTASSRIISGISTICVANISRYLSWPNLARGNDYSLGYSRACRIEAAAAAPNVHRRHLIRRELRLRLVQPQKKLRILFSPMASTASLECSGECAQGVRPEGLHAL